ncbi:cation diffusion facilitator family transporter [Chloroflexota bacterium]
MTGHTHHRTLPVASKLKFGIMLSSLILVLEVSGGLIANSLALLADAGHVLADIVALSLSWYALKQAERPASHSMTFGYHRIGVLIAIVNALSIFAIAVIVFFEAFRRLQEPPDVNSPVMLVVAAIGLGVNLFVASWLREEQKGNLNIRSAFWHALGDALASIGVIIGGFIILFTDIFIIDPIVSIVIGVIIVLAAWGIFRDGLRVLMEATPKDIDIKKLVGNLNRIAGVNDVHDIHVWSVSPEKHMMSCHVLIDNLRISEADAIRSKIEKVLNEQFNIEHATLQMEFRQCSNNDILCKINICKEESPDNKPPQ